MVEIEKRHLQILLLSAVEGSTMHPDPGTNLSALNDMILEQCVEAKHVGGGDGQYRLLPRGKKYIEMLCDTPLPEQTKRWADPREKT